jgi:hypothetical protein
MTLRTFLIIALLLVLEAAFLAPARAGTPPPPVLQAAGSAPCWWQVPGSQALLNLNLMIEVAAECNERGRLCTIYFESLRGSTQRRITGVSTADAAWALITSVRDQADKCRGVK